MKASFRPIPPSRNATEGRSTPVDSSPTRGARDIDISDLFSMRLPCIARNLFTVTTVDELKQALKFCQEHSVEPVILGGGSNSLPSPELEVVILNKIDLPLTLSQGGGTNASGFQNRFLGKEQGEICTITAGAGTNWDDFVAYTCDLGYFDLAPLSAIPGTVGATPIQNVGAYGTEVSNHIISVDVLDFETLTEKTFSNSECEFAYRDSKFKHEWKGKYIVTAVTFELKNKTVTIPDYPGVADEVEKLLREDLPPSPPPIEGGVVHPDLNSNFFYQTTKSKKYKELYEKAVEMRKNPTNAEKILWEALRGNQAGAKFRQQHIIHEFIVDFVCLQNQLIVEVDGEVHNEQKERDRERSNILQNLGYSILRFANKQIEDSLDDVIKEIKEELQKAPSLGGGWGEVTPQTIRTAITNIRWRKLPKPEVLPNCGSFFHNPIISSEQFASLQIKFPNMPGHKIESVHPLTPSQGGGPVTEPAISYKVPAGWLLDTAGLKGITIGNFGTSADNALVIVHHGKGTLAELLEFQAYLQKQIFDMFGIEIHREPLIL